MSCSSEAERTHLEVSTFILGEVAGSSPATATKTLQPNCKAQLITKTTSIMKQRFLKWWGKNNMTLSAITGETFTNGQVVCTHIGLVVFLMVMGLIGN